jgi:hypothetical protein
MSIRRATKPLSSASIFEIVAEQDCVVVLKTFDPKKEREWAAFDEHREVFIESLRDFKWRMIGATHVAEIRMRDETDIQLGARGHRDHAGDPFFYAKDSIREPCGEESGLMVSALVFVRAYGEAVRRFGYMKSGLCSVFNWRESGLMCRSKIDDTEEPVVG